MFEEVERGEAQTVIALWKIHVWLVIIVLMPFKRFRIVQYVI
jgi:hypothetical protein